LVEQRITKAGCAFGRGPFKEDKMGIESYKHQFAKATLAQWFREIAAVDEDRGTNKLMFKNFYWRVNRGAPHYGIWVEYPVALDNQNRIVGFDPVWDEDSRWGFEGTEDGECIALERAGRPPTYEEVIELGLTPILIFDVAIQHKGSIIYALEVVHRNGISETKLDYINRARTSCNCLQVHTIDADWILSRIKRPDELICQRIV
jgi:hypothetical protein